MRDLSRGARYTCGPITLNLSLRRTLHTLPRPAQVRPCSASHLPSMANESLGRVSRVLFSRSTLRIGEGTLPTHFWPVFDRGCPALPSQTLILHGCEMRSVTWICSGMNGMLRDAGASAQPYLSVSEKVMQGALGRLLATNSPPCFTISIAILLIDELV